MNNILFGGFKMNLQKLAIYGSLVAGLSACNDPETNKSEVENDDYFATISDAANSHTGLALITGDFDMDWDLDFIVGTINENDVRLYRFVNNGSGEFGINESTLSAERTENLLPPYGWPDCSGNLWETDACAEVRQRLGHD